MASVPGSKLAFFAPGFTGSQVNVVLTADGTGVLPTVAGAFNIEVFTSTPGALAPGFQGSAFIQGATQITNNLIQAASRGPGGSIEQLLSGNYVVIDQTGGQSIQIVGSGAGGTSMTVVGSSGDTITGSSNAANSQLIDASGLNPSAVKGAQTIVGGAGNTTVWAGTGDSITGGAGALTVVGDGEASLGGASKVTIVGGAGNLTAFNLGHGFNVTGSTSGFTFVDDNYSGGGGNTIVGGAKDGVVTTPLGSTVAAGTFIIGGTGDLITGGAGSMLVNALKGGMTVNGGTGVSTVWGAAGDSITGGTGFMQAGGGKSTIVGGATGSMLVIGGAEDTIKAGGGTMTVIGGSKDTVTGGAGSLQFNAGTATTLTGGAGAVSAFNLGISNSISGSTGAFTFIDDSYTSLSDPTKFTGGLNTLVGGLGASRIIAGPGDSVVARSGPLETEIRSNLNASETVDLSAGTSSDGVRDVSVLGGLGAKVTVTGFATVADKIESAQSVDSSGKFIGVSTVVGGDTLLTFLDGTTMTLVGVSDPTKITFTQ
jgi:hypothetical protein